MRSITLLACLVGVSISCSVSAQQNQDQEAGPLEEIVVTGSLIRRSSFDTPTPVQQITAADINLQGASTIQDVVRNLAINTGSQMGQFNLDFGAGGGSTSQFNLRGLGLNATLTLIDGHRLAPNATGGSSAQYVNLSQIPASMVERIDILKTGASATYGSDAVAGVVNIITKKDYQGFEVNLDYRDSSTVPWSEWSLSGSGGISDERGHATVGFEIQNRDLLATRDIPSSQTYPGTAGTFLRSGFGQPGAFLAPGGPPVRDPLCGAAANAAGVGVSLGPDGVGSGLCSIDLLPFFAVLPDDERTTGWGNFEYSLTDAIEAYGQIGYSRQRSENASSPSFPLINQDIIVPGTHPDFPAELAAALPGGIAQDVEWLGRPIGNNAGTLDFGRNPRERDSFLTVLGLRGEFEIGDRDWNWEGDIVGSRNETRAKGNAVAGSRLQAALDACRDPADPLFNSVAPGCWNPFGNALTDGTPNSDEVYNFFHDAAWSRSRNELTTYDFVVSGGIADLSAGELAVAFGIQQRQESFLNDPTDITNRGDATFGGQSDDTYAERDVNAIFAELAIPYARGEVQIAARHEDYDDVGSSTDPRVAVSFEASDAVTLRATWGTSFRAPQLNQLSGVSNGVERIRQLNTGSDLVRPVTSFGGNLVPEEAESFTVGVQLDFGSFQMDIDYWDYTYDGLLAEDSAQRIVDVVCPGPIGTGCDLANPLASQIEFDSGGEVERVFVGFINAAETQISGVDVTGSWGTEGSWGSYDLGFDLTYIDSFELQTAAGAPFVDIVGQHNRTNIAPSLPELRWNISNTWRRNDNRITVFVRHVDGVVDERSAVIPYVDDHLTVDLTYGLDLPNFGSGGAGVSVGAINLFDNDVPQVDNETSFAPDLHDVRGRTWYVSFNQRF
jgi:outer membrane receptor protein involved in Fe transport